MITGRDVERYQETGYLVVENVLDDDELAEARLVLAELVAGARGVSTHTEIYDLEPTHRPEAPRVRRIKKPHAVHPFFARLARQPRLVPILQRLLGPDVRLYGSKINLKLPYFGSPIEWHQDWAFYPHTNDDVLAVGVMLDDVGPDNGPMLVLPGTHRGKVWDHHRDGYFCGAMQPEECDGLDFDKAVPLTGSAGSITIHHVRLVHGSAQNLSDRSRQFLLYEYAAADAWPLHNLPDLATFDARMIAGRPSIEPRLAAVPVRMPLPPARHQGSIYENQIATGSRFFAVTGEAVPA